MKPSIDSLKLKMRWLKSYSPGDHSIKQQEWGIPVYWTLQFCHEVSEDVQTEWQTVEAEHERAR